MLRATCVVSVAVLLASSARGDDCLGNVCSYAGSFVAGEVVGTTPPQGFILTDIVTGEEGAALITVLENGLVKALARLEPGAGISSVHFVTGIPFTGGSEITVSHSTTNPASWTLSGYIPNSPPTAGRPAPPSTKLSVGMMIVSLIAAGGWTFCRRKGFVRA